VLLFIDRLPFHGFYPLLPMLVSEPEEETPPADAICRSWKYDTGNALDASAWRFHLARCGLYPCAPDRLAPRRVQAMVASGEELTLPVRKACLWLVSNLPHLRATPYRVPLYSGIPFRRTRYPRPDRRKLAFPLLGVRACHRAGLRIRIDADNLTVSVWTPGPSIRNMGRLLRRAAGGFSRLTWDDLCEDTWC
jgi:hypothetical protein